MFHQLRIERLLSDDFIETGWLPLRRSLWSSTRDADHLQEMRTILKSPTKAVWISWCGSCAMGFAEASIRFDYVNGCHASPVGFLEGIYVEPAFRRQGVARQLVTQVGRWAYAQGCLELASDTGLDNRAGQAMHRSLGFEETERVVFFRLALDTVSFLS